MWHPGLSAELGGAIGGGAGRAGSIFDLLAPLDYPRQALWNVPASLAKGDFLGALPGLVGGLAGAGLAATGAGIPMALLGGTLGGGLMQGLGKASGMESFDAPTPNALLEALGGSSEGVPGMLQSMALGAAGDPLMWSGFGLGGGGAKSVGRAFQKGISPYRDIEALGPSMASADRASAMADMSANPLYRLSEAVPGTTELTGEAARAGLTAPQLTNAAKAGYAGRNQSIADQVVEYAKTPEGALLPESQRVGHHLLDSMEAYPNPMRYRNAMERLTPEATENIEFQLNRLLREKPPGWQNAAQEAYQTLKWQGRGSGLGMPREFHPTMPWQPGDMDMLPEHLDLLQRMGGGRAAAAGGVMSLDETMFMEQMLKDVMLERAPGWERQASQMAKELHKRGMPSFQGGWDLAGQRLPMVNPEEMASWSPRYPGEGWSPSQGGIHDLAHGLMDETMAPFRSQTFEAGSTINPIVRTRDVLDRQRIALLEALLGRRIPRQLDDIGRLGM